MMVDVPSGRTSRSQRTRPYRQCIVKTSSHTALDSYVFYPYNTKHEI